MLPVIVTTLAGLAVVAVVASEPPATRAASFTDRSPVGQLDQIRSVPGGVRAVGWDLDPDAKTAPVRTNARVNGSYVAGTLADLPRPALAADYPRAGIDHGFTFFAPVPEGEHRVCIRAKNIARGTNYVLGCVTRNFDYGPFGKLERLRTTPGHVFVKGWAIDHDAAKAPITVTVTIDGAPAASFPADRYRKDLLLTHGIAGADHGFARSISMSQGMHTVCVNTKNIGYGSDNTFGCRRVTLNDSPRGSLDSAAQHAGALRVTGWAFDRDDATRPLTVAVKVDNTTHLMVADAARNDVAAKYPAVGKYHGFTASYTLPTGRHTVCVTADNVGYGSNVTFPCRTAVLNFTPTAAITALRATGTGATVSGWATDPDTAAPISVSISADGSPVKTISANGTGSTHSGHTFTLAVPLRSGTHTVCATALNVLYGTRNSTPACRTITLALRPLGAFESLTRQSGSANLAVQGWTLDPDTTQPISVAITLDGQADATVRANATRTDIGRAHPGFGNDHGIATVVTADDGEHTVCVTALNVGGGSDRNLGCKLITAVNPAPPSAPRNVTAVAGYGGAEVSWSPPASDGGAPWTKYTVVTSPGGGTVTTGPHTTTATILGLKPKTAYTFAVRAVNPAGASAAGTSPSVSTQANPPPQTTPAPVSTSRYTRNLRDAAASERATMRTEGATDAYYNPSGHGYLVLLDIGGQDQYDGGVVLSATTRFVTYGNLVSDLKAYVDGYHSKQRASAPVTIAIGTNNDMDVSYGSGKTWAASVVQPLASYARSHYSGITIAGANDIEPGFRAGYAATNSWLSGYLSGTKAPFVFNGSADGCSWTAISRGCNNGWTMGDLYHLAAGAAPVRMVDLPQIYNTTMAAQWKYISLTGVAVSRPRINFGGTLTEWTACAQSNSCGSLTGHSAWTTMWNDLQSDRRLKVASLPYSTDLRIDR